MIKDLKDGISGSGNYIVKSLNKGLGSNGQAFLTIVLQDASGYIDAKKWNATEEDEILFKVGNILHIDADCVTFKDRLQLKIKFASLLDSSMVDMNELIKESEFSEEELINKLNYFCESFKNQNIRKIVMKILKKYQDKFMVYPAAVSMHHDYYRGLFEHSISMAIVAEFLANHYKDINKDYLIAGALLHDVGKCEELSGVIGTSYTTKGDLLGHLLIGQNLVIEASKELNIEGEEVMILSHLIASHHGSTEKGALLNPITKEALLLSMIDDIDAKMKLLEKAYSTINEGEFTEKILGLENRKFYKPFNK